jgi:hypothetical protein
MTSTRLPESDDRKFFNEALRLSNRQELWLIRGVPPTVAQAVTADQRGVRVDAQVPFPIPRLRPKQVCPSRTLKLLGWWVGGLARPVWLVIDIRAGRFYR